MSRSIKILTILGARPQFIKAGAVSRAISKNKSLEEIIVHTGQHYDYNMSDLFFEELSIPKPRYKFALEGRTHGAMTAEILKNVEEVMLEVKPDVTLVYGDTNTTLAGAIAASKLNIPIAHVESGLRSFNNTMPEEINRIVTDRIASLLFCPTQISVKNLSNEGITKNVFQVGDVMYDSILYYKNKGMHKPKELASYNIPVNFILCTVHRQGNTDDVEKLKSIFALLKKFAQKMEVVLPLHPRTKKRLQDLHLDLTGITIIDPVGYLSMLYLLDNCSFVLTDSGGLQKESYFCNKYCGILRTETEWQELIDHEAACLINLETDDVESISSIATSYTKSQVDLYGKGNASELITEALKSYFK